jgi:predicted nucleic acid-binding Zn ribbon protein
VTSPARPRKPGRAGRAAQVPRTLGTQPAAAAVAAALEHHGITEQVRAGRVVTEWTELVGARIAQRTRPDAVVDRVLWVEVATSAWLHELNLLRPQLLENLITRIGKPALFDELKFRLAGRTRRDPVVLRAARKPPPPARPAPPPATGIARERIIREAGAVDDDELRELIARVRITHDR